MTTRPTSIAPVFTIANPDTEPSDGAIAALARLLVALVEADNERARTETDTQQAGE